MVSIQIDEQTAAALTAAAAAAGVSISDFLKLMVPPGKETQYTAWGQFGERVHCIEC